jgi:hypothetical protein
MFLVSARKARLPLAERKARQLHIELGEYHCKYWFNEELGLIRLYYTKPDGSVVDLYLGSTNFE